MKTFPKTVTNACLAGAVLLQLSLSFWCSKAADIALGHATADYSQDFFPGDPPFTVDKAIDGSFDTGNGWAIYPQVGMDHVAVFETQSDTGFALGSELTFTLSQMHVSPVGEHTLGRFRLSLTTDSRDEFADGLPSGGDVSANWRVLRPLRFWSRFTNDIVMTRMNDNSILVSGVNPVTNIYTVKVHTTLTNITGFRIEALSDSSLPAQGPGRAFNGNFVLTEFQVSIEPSAPPLDIRVSQIELCWETTPDLLYQLEYTDANGWLPFGNKISGTGDRICTNDFVPVGHPARLYRLSVTNAP